MIIFLSNELNITIRIAIANSLTEKTLSELVMLNAKKEVSILSGKNSAENNLLPEMTYDGCCYIDIDMMKSAMKNNINESYKSHINIAPKIEGDNFYMNRALDSITLQLMEKELGYDLFLDLKKKISNIADHSSADIVIEGLSNSEIKKAVKELGVQSDSIVFSNIDDEEFIEVKSLSEVPAALDTAFDPGEVDFSSLEVLESIFVEEKKATLLGDQEIAAEKKNGKGYYSKIEALIADETLRQRQNAAVNQFFMAA